MGNKKDLKIYYKTSDLFVLTSDWEGFSNVIAEALEYGLPVITTDHRYGPVEILDKGKFGTIVKSKNINYLINAIDKNLKQNIIETNYSLDLKCLIKKILPLNILIYLKMWFEKLYLRTVTKFIFFIQSVLVKFELPKIHLKKKSYYAKDSDKYIKLKSQYAHSEFVNDLIKTIDKQTINFIHDLAFETQIVLKKKIKLITIME